MESKTTSTGQFETESHRCRVLAFAFNTFVTICSLLLIFLQRQHPLMTARGLRDPLNDNKYVRSTLKQIVPVEDVVQSIVDIAQRAEEYLEDYDYMDMAITAARLLTPSVDEHSIRIQIETMAKEAAVAWSSHDLPREKVASLSRVIFERNRFGIPSDDAPVLSGQNVFETYSLPGVLNGKKGFCEGLSTVYFLVAKQAELPVSIVNLPIHTLLQVTISGESFEQVEYIESTMSGKKRETAVVRSMNGAKRAATTSGVYFSPLSKRQFLNLHVNAMAYGLMQQEEGPSPLTLEQMVRIADAITWLDPKRPESLDTAALIYYTAGYYDDAIATMGQAVKLSRQYGAPSWVRTHYRKMENRYLSRGTED